MIVDGSLEWFGPSHPAFALAWLAFAVVTACFKRRGRSAWTWRQRVAAAELAAAVPAFTLAGFHLVGVVWRLIASDGWTVSDTYLAFTFTSVPAFTAVVYVLFGRAFERGPQGHGLVLVCYAAALPTSVYAVQAVLTMADEPSAQVWSLAVNFALLFLAAVHQLPALLRDAWRERQRPGAGGRSTWPEDVRTSA